jgi:hypothetical protein
MIKGKSEAVKSIEWHEECIQRMSIRYRDELIRAKDRLEKEIGNLVSDIITYQAQVDLAKTRGLKEFDRDRFGIKKSKLSVFKECQFTQESFDIVTLNEGVSLVK